MTFRQTWRQHAARLFVVLAFSLVRPPLAFAQGTTPTPPAQLPLRDANFAWDQNLLLASFSFRDILDPPVRQKLSNGPAVTIAMRASFYREGETTPVALVVQTCVVSYDLWQDVYRVQVTNTSGTADHLVANAAGVERYCGFVQNFPITARSVLKPGAPHFLAVTVDVDPVSQAVRDQMRQWMQRPVGAVAVGPGDALFTTLTLLLFRGVGDSYRTIEFRTRSFVP